MGFREFLEEEKRKELQESAEKKFLIEGGLSRILTHLENRNLGIITAFRGNFTLAENRRRNKDLENRIRTAGLGYYKADGHYIESYGQPGAMDVHEEVFIVMGAKVEILEYRAIINPEADYGYLKGFLYKEGKRFDQDSVLVKEVGVPEAYLIGCKDFDEKGEPVFPGDRREHKLGPWSPMKIGKFYTRMKGKPFVFESVAPPPSFMGEWLKHAKSKAEQQ